MKYRLGHIGIEPAYFIELADQLLFFAKALVVLDKLGAVFKEDLAGILRR